MSDNPYDRAMRQASATMQVIYSDLQRDIPDFVNLPPEVQAALINGATRDCASMNIVAALDELKHFLG